MLSFKNEMDLTEKLEHGIIRHTNSSKHLQVKFFGLVLRVQSSLHVEGPTFSSPDTVLL